MRCVPQTAVSEHDLDGIAVLQVLDYSGGHTLDNLIEYVEKQMAGVSMKMMMRVILMMRGRSLRSPRMNYEYH